MAQIIRIDEFHRPLRPQHPARRAADRREHTRLFCTRCRCESFALLLSGAVACVNCEAKIRNVRVLMEEPAATQDP